jgi:hypothetical protein
MNWPARKFPASQLFALHQLTIYVTDACAIADRAGQLLNTPTGVQQLPDLRSRSDAFGKIAELSLQRGIAHRHLKAADGMLDVLVQLPAILQLDRKANLFRLGGWIDERHLTDSPQGSFETFLDCARVTDNPSVTSLLIVPHAFGANDIFVAPKLALAALWCTGRQPETGVSMQVTGQ